jgi:hypothetical protein
VKDEMRVQRTEAELMQCPASAQYIGRASMERNSLLDDRHEQLGREVEEFHDKGGPERWDAANTLASPP